jgi:hypothetical protein
MTYSIKYENIILITEKYFKNKYNYNLLINSKNKLKPISLKKYNDIIEDINNYYSELITIYLNNYKNKQIIIDNNNNIIYESNIFTINYIDKIIILIFISFVLELLNFYIIHCEIYDIINFKKVIIKHSVNFNIKKYNEKLINDLSNGFYFIITNFYVYINNIYNNFINYFINTLFIKYDIDFNEIEDCFIYKKENNYNENNKFLIIYDNWKFRLSNLLKISNNKIDSILYYCLKNLSNNNIKYNISNTYGFFEIMYLNNKYNGNSFTYTIIEQYILLKLYYDPYKINIILQKNNNELNTNIMYYTQIGLYDNLNKTQINLYNFSHWASNFYVYNDNKKLISYKLRILNKNDNYSFSIATNKEYYFKSLLYIIIDNIINYLNKINIKDNFLNLYFNNIFNFLEYKFKNNLEKNNNYNSFKIYELINSYINCNDILYNCNIIDIDLVNNNINKININDCIDIKDMVINNFKIIDKEILNNITVYIDTYKDVIEDSKEVYKTVVTKFINNNFYSTSKTSYYFYKLINNTVNNALNEYCNTKNIDNKSIFFIFKGGNILRIIVEQVLENNFNNYQMEEINKLKNANFKRSDSDFQIYIKNLIGTKFLNSDIVITKEIMDSIYDDICNLTYLILNRIRNIILLDVSKYIYFYQLNNKIQSELLTKLLNELNEIEDDINFTCLKFEDFIIGDNDLNNYPFNSNINIYDNNNSKNDFAILELSKEDESIVSKNFKKLPILNENKKRLFLTDINYLHNRPTIPEEQIDNILEKKLIYKYRNKTNYFISVNNSLNLVKNNINFKFNLIRMKINLTAYYTQLNKNDNKHYTNITNLPGEFIDIVIPRYDNASTEHFFKSIDDGDESIIDYQISLENEQDINIKSYSIKYFITELELMLFNELPWFLVKYEKRLERLLLLYIIMFIQSFIKNNKYRKYYNKIIAYKNILSNINKENINIDNINIIIKEKIKTENENNELFDKLFSVYISKINLTVKENIDELNKLIIFYQVIYQYIDILEKTFNRINIKQFNTVNKLEYYDKYLKYKFKYNNNK